MFDWFVVLALIMVVLVYWLTPSAAPPRLLLLIDLSREFLFRWLLWPFLGFAS